MARQAWPELTVAPTKSFGATSFSSTSSSTSAASLPPSSSVRRFNVPDAFAITLLPVAVDLVRVPSPRLCGYASNVYQVSNLSNKLIVTVFLRSERCYHRRGTGRDQPFPAFSVREPIGSAPNVQGPRADSNFGGVDLDQQIRWRCADTKSDRYGKGHFDDRPGREVVGRVNPYRSVAHRSRLVDVMEDSRGSSTRAPCRCHGFDVWDESGSRILFGALDPRGLS